MFTPDQTVAIASSPALAQRRRDAAQRALDGGLPSFEEEVWRYSPIDDLDLGRFELGAPGGTVQSMPVTDPLLDTAAAVVTVVDGVAIDQRVTDDAVTIHVIGADDEGDALGAVMIDAVDVFADLNLGLATAPIVISVRAGAVVEAPIVVRYATGTDRLAWFPRTVLDVGENAQCTVVEHHVSADVGALVAPVTEINVQQAARCKHLTVQQLGPEVWQLGSQMSNIARDAYLQTSQVALGGGYARMRIDTRMVGQGATGDIAAVYFGKGDSSLDFRTFQTHVAPHTDSNLLFKGAVDDASRAIYTGLIRIEPDASAVTAYQTNRNLKLSDDAWAESVPNLEIENNDVKCSHASAVGPVDADQQFYLESRGVPSDIAETLVVRGFFAEVLEQLPIPAIAEAVGGELSALLADDTALGVGA